MDTDSEQVPDELKETWSRLLTGRDAGKLRKHLDSLRQSVTLVKGLESSLKEAFEGTSPQAVDPNKRAQARSAVTSSLQSHSISMEGVLKVFSRLSAEGRSAIQRILGWVAEHMVGLLTTFAEHLRLQSWSVAGTLATFPPGAAFSITLTFV